MVNRKYIKRTDAYFKQEVFDLTNGEYVPTSPFVKMIEKVSMLHKTCGNTWSIRPRDFLQQGNRCPHCVGKYSPTTGEYSSKVETITDGEYVVKGEYVSNKTPIPMLHTVCGNEWMVAPNNFLSGKRCPHCAGRYSPTPEEYTDKVRTITDGEYVVEGEYVTNNTPIPMLHTGCGNTWMITPDNFLRLGNRCPNCIYSRGEKSVSDTLDSLGIQYTREFSFSRLGRYRYDFWIPNERIAIEYDGEFHYKAFSHTNGQAGLDKVRQSDQLKNQWCKQENIALLRIPYWEFDEIDTIVKEFIEDTRTFNELFAPNNEKETVL